MFGELDSTPVQKFHLRNVIVNGVGVFSDSYNLYAISLVFYSVIQYLSISKYEASVLTASSFFGAAIGAVLFGAIADRIGRKPMYGIDLVLILIGAGAQLFTTNFTFLFIARLILGFGIGGDYVMSPVIMAENSNSRDRGKLMATTFSVMYLFGAALAAFVVQITGLFLAPDQAWKVVLAFGAVPSLFVIYYRRKIPETYRFNTRVRGEPEKDSSLYPYPEELKGVTMDKVKFKDRLFRSLPVIITGSILWILYDTYSGTFSVYGPITIAANLGLTPVGFTYAAIFLAGLPGTLVSIYLIDRVGRKKLVVYGYAGVFIALVLYSLLLINPHIFGIPQSQDILGTLTGLAAAMGFTFYLFNYFASAVGPATIIGGTIIVPEMLPTKIRASGQSINVFIDRLAVGTFVSSFLVLLNAIGLGYVILIYGAIALSSSVIMYFLLPEAKGKTLEELSKETLEFSNA